MQVSPTGLIYHFQMSAVSAVNGIQIEGTLSSVSAMSTVYVPNPGIVCIYTFFLNGGNTVYTCHMGQGLTYTTKINLWSSQSQLDQSRQLHMHIGLLTLVLFLCTTCVVRV